MKNRNFWLAIIALIAVVSPFSFSDLSALSQSGSSNVITFDQVWDTDRTIDQTTKINSGVTVIVEKGVKISFSKPWIQLLVEGNLFVKGTRKEPVRITSDIIVNENSFSINSLLGGNVVIKNAEIENGGSSVFLVGFGHRALATDINHHGAVYGSGGKIDVQETTFRNNYKAVSLAGGFSSAHVNRSKFINNQMDVVSYSSADFQYNWWGDANGPIKTCNPYRCYYKKIGGSIDFSNWLKDESFRDPVVLIPGLLGSWEKNGKMELDPIFHTYDNLYAEFVANGYVPEKDLFTFPYEWRDSNVKNAQKLKTKIAEIRLAQKWPKVDLVAHSMGGLLAREYIESVGYGNDVDQLITVATPNLGAPEAYPKWEGDGWFFSLVDIYLKHVINQEAEEGGFADRFDYIHNRPVSSLKELLPVYGYLFDVNDNNRLKTYPINYPENIFLSNLNANAKKLNFVEYDKIVGNIDGENTIGGMNVISADFGKYWIHGYPLGFEIPIGDRGMRLISGDRTVPYESAKSENIRSDYFLELSSDHQGIVTDAQKDILEILTGIRPEAEVNKSLIKNILFTAVYSPIDIQIIAPDGKWAGKNIKGLNYSQQIADAYYTGHNKTSEFITIPNPEDGKYKIITQGMGAGEYKIEATKISEDPDNLQNAIESTGRILGNTEVGRIEEKLVEIKGGDVIAGDAEAPIINFQSPRENENYLNNQLLPFQFSVQDNVSAADKIIVQKYYDDNVLNTDFIDLSLEHLGAHKVKITATDEAGNESQKELLFTLNTNIQAIQDNANHYSDLGWIQNPGKKAEILAHLNLLEKIMHLKEQIEKSALKPRVKSLLSAELSRLIDLEIKNIVSKIGKMKPTQISAQAKNLLIESLKSLQN